MIKIRKAGTYEINTIKNLADAIWPATYKKLLSPDQIDYMMNLFYSPSSLAEQFTKHTFLIAYVDNEPAGFASYSPSANTGTYKLHKIYVNTTLQRRGLGKALINFIVEELKSSGGSALELNVKRDNPARLFYEKLGFEVMREEDINIGNNYWLQDYVMRISIHGIL
ncbi:MAG: GNAT family N-acetyltransferase [Chitinophagaceae bacterium]